MHVGGDSTRRASSADVAKAAGVSRTTVSFVLNDRPGIAIPEATKQRVWEAARRLGYTPSPEARALRKGHSSIVVCLLPDWPITGPLGVLLQRMSSELAAVGLTMLAHQRTDQQELSDVLAALTPTAILSLCDLSQAEVDLADTRDIPLFTYMGSAPGVSDEAAFQQTDVGRLQVGYLNELGHRSLLYLLPADHQMDWFSDRRLLGARERAEQLDATLTEWRISDSDLASLSRQMVAAHAAGMTGVCAYNDEVAFSALMAAERAGLDVPQDISIIGVDDSSICSATAPTLTSIRFGHSLEARRLADLIGRKTGVTAKRKVVPSNEELLSVIPRESSQRI